MAKTRQDQTNSDSTRSTTSKAPRHSMPVNQEKHLDYSHLQLNDEHHKNKSRSSSRRNSSRSTSKSPRRLSNRDVHSKSQCSTTKQFRSRSKSIDYQRSDIIEKSVHRPSKSPRRSEYNRPADGFNFDDRRSTETNHKNMSRIRSRSISLHSEDRRSSLNSFESLSKSIVDQRAISIENTNSTSRSNRSSTSPHNRRSRSISNNPTRSISISRSTESRDTLSRLNSNSPRCLVSINQAERKQNSNSKGYRRSNSTDVERRCYVTQSGRSINTDIEKPANVRQQQRSKTSYRRSHSPMRYISQKYTSALKLCTPACESKNLINTFNKNLDKLHKSNQLIDRRLTRMEVSMNKVLVSVGDITKSNIKQNTPLSGCDLYSNIPVVPRRRFEVPEFPITRMKHLYDFNERIQRKEFRNFLIDHEKEFCTSSKFKTNNVIMTAYLKRFICLELRNKILFRDSKDGGKTLFHHFNAVYLFLRDVMIDGYKSCHQKLKIEDAHLCLRIVWGRTKQSLKEQGKRNNF